MEGDKLFTLELSLSRKVGESKVGIQRERNTLGRENIFIYYLLIIIKKGGGNLNLNYNNMVTK